MASTGKRKRYIKINQASPAIAERIQEAARTTGYPKYAITNLMVRGALCEDLQGPHDRHVLENVLPVLLKNKHFLKALLSKVGGPEARIEFAKGTKEETPFDDYIRQTVEKLYEGRRPLVVNKIIADIRSGGPWMSYAQKLSEVTLKGKIRKIKNKVFLSESRKRARRGENQKLEWLRSQLVTLEERASSITLESYDLEASIEAAISCNARTIGASLNKLGMRQPLLIEEEKQLLVSIASSLLQLMTEASRSNIESWISEVFSSSDLARLQAYAAGRTVATTSGTGELSAILYKRWWMIEVAEKIGYPLDTSDPRSAQALYFDLRKFLRQHDADSRQLHSHAEALLPTIASMPQQELERVRVWLDEVLSPF